MRSLRAIVTTNPLVLARHCSSSTKRCLNFCAAARVVGSTSEPLAASGGAPTGFSSGHKAGSHFLMGDGTVRMIAAAIDAEVYRALATRDGGESVPGDY